MHDYRAHDLWQHLQRQLFPVLLEEVGELGEKDRQFVQVVALLPLGPLLARYDWKGVGCPPHERVWLLHAFIAKEVYQFPTREALVDALKARPTAAPALRLGERQRTAQPSTFCRAFGQFAADELPQAIHEALVKRHCGPQLVGHISRDATAIAAPEQPTRRPATEPTAPGPVTPRKRGRPKKGEARPAKPATRLQLQPARTLAQNLADLPRSCDCGGKKGSKGQMEYWQGYKLHLDVIDGDIPVSAVMTSASTHDSQVAIPLMQMTSQRVTALYELMDAAYDAEPIHAYARSLGHVPIIEPVQRGAWVPLDPAQRQRFRRARSQRASSTGRLKEYFGGRTVRLRGAAVW